LIDYTFSQQLIVIL